MVLIMKKTWYNYTRLNNLDRRKFLKNTMAIGTILSVPLPYSSRLFAASLPSDLTDLSASDLSIAIRTKQASCVEAMQAYLDRIHRYYHVYNTIALNPVFDDLTPLDLEDIKIGWMGNLENYLPVEPEIIELCEASLKSVADTGAQVKPLRTQFMFSDLWQSWNVLRQYESLYLLSYFEDPVTRKLMKPEVIWEIEQGLRVTAKDVEKAINGHLSSLDGSGHIRQHGWAAGSKCSGGIRY